MCALIASVNGVVSDPAAGAHPGHRRGTAARRRRLRGRPHLRRPPVRDGRAPAAHVELGARTCASRSTSSALQADVEARARAGRARSTRAMRDRSSRAAAIAIVLLEALKAAARTTLALAPITYSPTRILDGVKSLSLRRRTCSPPAWRRSTARRGAARHAARPGARGADVARSSTRCDGEQLLHAAAGRPHPRLDHPPPRHRGHRRAGAGHDAPTTSPRSRRRSWPRRCARCIRSAGSSERELPAPGPADARRRRRRRASGSARSRRRSERRHGHRQPPAVRQGGGGVAPAARARTTRCSSTPASTTTTSCRRSSSRELGVPRPERRARHPRRHEHRADRAHARGARAAAGRAPPGPSCSSTATRTRRWPAALAAAQARIPVAHVEAGMRSFDRAMPEELNRVLTDHASDLLLCPSQTAVDNLRREGVAGRGRARRRRDGRHRAASFQPRAREPSAAGGVRAAPYVLATAHRAGNVDDPRAAGARSSTCCSRSPEDVVLPLHPRTRARLEARGPARSAWRAGVELLRAAGLPGLHRAARPRPRGAHRLRRRAEGGLPRGRAVRDAARHDRVDRDGRRRLERARRPRSRRGARGAASARRRPSAPSSTATGAPASACRQLPIRLSGTPPASRTIAAAVDDRRRPGSRASAYSRGRPGRSTPSTGSPSHGSKPSARSSASS